MTSDTVYGSAVYGVNHGVATADDLRPANPRDSCQRQPNVSARRLPWLHWGSNVPSADTVAGDAISVDLKAIWF